MVSLRTSRIVVSGILLSMVLCSCHTEPGETTTMGAATGGVLGAGLGAIVGSQSGNAGTGMALGAAAGAGAGAMVGNALEAQEQAIHSQDLAIEKQEQIIRSQRNELDSLKGLGQDRVVFKGAAPRDIDPRASTREWSTGVSAAAAVPIGRSEQGAVWDTSPVTSGAIGADSPGPVSAAPRLNTPECIKAENEVKSAAQALEAADKLFHYRRALRLCPANAGYHNGLGEVYLTLGRKADAEFEFKEALKLDPELDSAARNLSALNQHTGAAQNAARY